MSTRIIPARAGFTSSHPSTTPGTPDHPRSRGVYQISMWTKRLMRGSSPLARGLLSTSESDNLALGIIPARAGFTDLHRDAHAWNWDHPRSRGVYTCASAIERRDAGSSPLARGLPM